jgi:long-subunit acyl-CoA synthetase (AMP-forming)
MPKGVLLSHNNLFSALAGAVLRGVVTRETDVHLSYLPLAHVMERLIQVTVTTGTL